MLFSKDSEPIPLSPMPGEAQDHPAPAHSIELPNHDLHNHTVLCGHADDDATVENLIARANELQLDVLGFSEHVMRAADLDLYEQYQKEAHRHRSSATQILVGVEMDIDPADPEAHWVVPLIGCDYVILSAHGFPRFASDAVESEPRLPQPMLRRELAERWLGWYGLAVARGGMHILGHPLREPINMGLIDLADPEMLSACVDIFRPTAEQGVAFELNNAFLEHLDAFGQFGEYVELIRRLRSIGVRFARGSDSHGATELGGCQMIAMAADAAGLHASDWIDPHTLFGR